LELLELVVVVVLLGMYLLVVDYFDLFLLGLLDLVLLEMYLLVVD
jgi:hypothetical protein